MIIQFVLIIQTIILGYYSEVPSSICSINKPFEKSDNTCGDFDEICVKKDDVQCNNFQAACKQCPPTNFTVLLLLQLKNEINLCNKKFEDIRGQGDDSQRKIKDTINSGTVTTILTIIAVIIILFIIQIVVTVVIIKKRTIVKCFLQCRKKKEKTPDKIEENKKLLNKDERTNEAKDYESLLQDLKGMINEKNNAKLFQDCEAKINEKVASYKLRFQIANQIDETKLFVYEFDSIIKLKKSICDGNMNDYKRMIMKYKDVTLDNNQYLLSYIDSTNIYPIFCEFDDNIDVDAMIVIKLKCDNIYPEMLQIWKYQTIKDVKNIISELNKSNHEDLLIFYKSNQLDDDDKSIDDYKIEDNDSIFVVNKSEKKQSISMKSIFNDKETIFIEISKCKKVESIINKSIQKIQHKMAPDTTNHFAVFLNNKLLENEKFIYEYNIDSKSLVEFCYFKSLKEIENISQLTNFGYFRLFTAKNKSFDKMVIFKGYSKKNMENRYGNDLSMILKRDLQMFQIIKHHSRFVQLVGIYINDDTVYIELENSTKITMMTFLSNNNEISTYQISKWANQILEGLKHLHNHNIIMKDMNPIDIMIDDNQVVKLPSLNMTEYLNHLNDEDGDNYKHTDGVLIYVAPEILEGKPYEASVDVWSLGVVMIEIMTGAGIFYGDNEASWVQKIKKSHTIEYDKTNKPPDLIDFIDCCVKGDPKERSTIDQLMKHEFIGKLFLFKD